MKTTNLLNEVIPKNQTMHYKQVDATLKEFYNNISTDTKKLLETQKGLMSMLNQMRPVLADGKELLQTFSGMFGSGGPVKL
jgi:hypothetical protein